MVIVLDSQECASLSKEDYGKLVHNGAERWYCRNFTINIFPFFSVNNKQINNLFKGIKSKGL